MIDLKLFAEEVLGSYECFGIEGKQKMITFLEDNNWFGSKPVLVDGKVMLTSDQVKLYREPLKIFFAAQSSKVNYGRMITMLRAKFPETTNQLTVFLIQ